VAAGLVVLFVACGQKGERKPLVSVDSRHAGNGGSGTGGSGGKGGSGATGGSGTKGGSGGSPSGDGGEVAVGGTGDAGSSGSNAGGGEASSIPDDCTQDADCPGGHCVTLSVGFRTCATAPVEATACSPNPALDDCCATSDCTPGLTCFSSRAFNYSGPSYEQEFNVCTSDGCTRDSDCLNNAICVPSGTLGRPISYCVSALCLGDTDCTELPDGRCTPMVDECDGGYWAFACAYPGFGSCTTNADCSSDRPPFGPGESYCHLGSCTDQIAGTTCE